MSLSEFLGYVKLLLDTLGISPTVGVFVSAVLLISAAAFLVRTLRNG